MTVIPTDGLYWFQFASTLFLHALYNSPVERQEKNAVKYQRSRLYHPGEESIGAITYGCTLGKY